MYALMQTHTNIVYMHNSNRHLHKNEETVRDQCQTRCYTADLTIFLSNQTDCAMIPPIGLKEATSWISNNFHQKIIESISN